MTIHRRGCPKAFDTDPERRVEITWDSKARINRSVQLRVVTANQPGILANVGQTFMAQGINISEANCRASDDGRAVNLFSFVCAGPAAAQERDEGPAEGEGRRRGRASLTGRRDFLTVAGSRGARSVSRGAF